MASQVVDRQAAPRAKGPLVWLDMDQQALDDAYDQQVYAANRAQIVERRLANSERARAILGNPQRVAYGPTAIETLDIFRSTRPNAPINVFIHGGAWRRNKAADYAVQAEMSFAPAPTPSFRTSSTWRKRAAACFPWPSRCVARCSGCIATPQASGETRSASI